MTIRTKQSINDSRLAAWLEVPDHTSSNRHLLNKCFVLDGAVRALRVAKCFPPSGSPPFSYLGKHILYIDNGQGSDIHSREDIILAEYHLRNLGWDEKI